jgi:hypothetical protein
MGKFFNQQNFLLWTLFIIALVPRLPTISSPLAGDEAITFNHYAHLKVLDILFNYPDSNQHSFFTILSNFCLLILGDHELAFRLPSLVSGVLAIPLAYYTFRVLGLSQTISVVSALLLALYVPHIAYSQEGRGYALTVFLALCLVCCSVHMLRRQRLWLWGAGLAVSATCMVITLPSNAFFVAGAAGFCWVLRKFKKPEDSTEHEQHSYYLVPYFLSFILIVGYLLINLADLQLSAQGNSRGEPHWKQFQEIAEFLVSPWGLWLYPFFMVGVFSNIKKEAMWAISALFLIPIALTLITGIVGFARIYIYFSPFVFMGVAMGGIFLYEKIKSVNFKLAHVGLALSLCWIIYQPALSLTNYYPKRMQVGNGYMEDAIELQKYFNNQPLNILPVITNAATGRSILIHYLGGNIGERIRLFLFGKDIEKVLFFCKKGIPPNKYQLQNILNGIEVPKIGERVKLVKSFGSFQVFEWEVELSRISRSPKYGDYESQVADIKFEQAETFLIEEPRAVGKKSLLVKNNSSGLITLGSPRVFNFGVIKKEGYILNLFLKPQWHKTFFRTIILNKGNTKTPSAYLNPYLNPDQNILKSNSSDFKWEMVIILSSIGKGKNNLQDIVQTNERSTIIDGINTYLIKSKN